jgi:hypothetical protein
MGVLVFEWKKCSGFQLLVSDFMFPLSKETNYNKFWDYVRKQIITSLEICPVTSSCFICWIKQKLIVYITRADSVIVGLILENQTRPFQPASNWKCVSEGSRTSSNQLTWLFFGMNCSIWVGLQVFVHP